MCLKFNRKIFFLCISFFLSFSFVHAAGKSTSAHSTVAKAFYLDNKLWPINTATQTYDIPYCWENLTQITANSTVNARRNALSGLLATTWGKYTRLHFYQTATPQCRPVGSLPLYTGIRIRVDPYKFVTTISGNVVVSPYVLAPGTQIKNRQDGVVLDLLAPFVSKIGASCIFGYSTDTCINTATVHEFGHVIGMSHEQNRSDAVSGGSCADVAAINNKRDPRVGVLSTDLLIGNIRIGDYDLKSIMNYCNSAPKPAWTLSPADITAAQIYYGNMPAVLSPVGQSGVVGKGLRTVVLPTVYENNIAYRYELIETGEDLHPKDNIIDPVYKVVSKTPLTTLQKPSIYVQIYNSLTRTITVPTFKRVVNNINLKDNNSGRVSYIAKMILTRQTNGTFIMGSVVKLSGVYSNISWQ